MRKSFLNKFFVSIASLSLLFNSLATPLYVYAQELTPTPELTPVETSTPTPIDEPTISPTPTEEPTPTPEPTITPTPTVILTPTPTETSIPTATPTVTPEPTPTQTPSPWTFENVELNKKYQNGGVTLIFTKLPSPAGNIKIEEIKLLPDQQLVLGAFSDTVYDITSTMENRTFSYDLILPLPLSARGKDIEVKSGESVDQISDNVDQPKEITNDTVTITGLDHFTIFVVTHTQADCSGGVYAAGVCYATIQAAINADTTLNGDTINIAAGDYTENLTIAKSLSLIGVGDTTHIIGGIDANGASVTIQDLKITNSNSGTFYYGVRASANNALILENVTINVLYYGVRMRSNDPSTGAVITINNSRIKGYAAIFLNGSNDALAVVNTGTVINVFNTSLIGTTSYDDSGNNDFAVIALAYTSGVHVNFTGTSSVANEFTGGAKAKENLILFYFNADNNSVTGTPTYTNAVNSTTNAVELFESAYGPYTNTVEGQVVARYVEDTTKFQAALASASTTPIVVGRGDLAITTTQDNTLNTGVTLLIDANNTPTTIAAGKILTNNGTIIVESGATLTNNGIIRGTGTITGTVGGTGTIDADHTVTFDANSGSGSMSAQTINVSTALTANAFTRTGYTFAGWNTVALGGGTPYADGASYDFSADATLYAQWTVNSYTITFNSDGGSDVAPIVQNYGTAVTPPTAPTKEGYTFSAWLPVVPGTMGLSQTLVAQWNINSYTLTYTAGDNGTITGTISQTVNYGANGTGVIAVPNEGYTFVKWSDDVMTATRTDTNIIANKSVTATFADQTAPNTPIIITTSKSVNTNTTQITGTAEADSTITITGGVSTATGTATGGNYSITVTLNQNVVNNLNVTAKDGSNNESSPATVAITHDNIVPTGTIVINSGATITNSNTVTLTIGASADLSGVTQMNIANSSSYHGWETYAVSKTWTLSENDGSKTVRVQFKDAAGNETETGIPAYITVDTTKPVIASHDNITIEATSNAGATVTYTSPATSDAVDGASTAVCTPASDTVFAIGTTIVNCTKTDVAGNTATPTTFNVIVQDITIPVITRNGAASITLEIKTPYTDAGATATDIVGGNLTSSIVTVNPVNVNIAGTYTITYNVDDAAQNHATQVTRTIIIQDSIEEAFNTISSTLAGAPNYVANNLNDVTTDNIQNFSPLYFEKSIDGQKVGRITFTASLDLTSDATQTFLQNLGDYMEANPGSMSFDARTQAGMKAAGAEIKMYGINALGYTGITPIIVKDDSGNILSEGDENYPLLSAISYAAGDGGTLTFSTNHFTQFDLPDQNQTTPDSGGDATLSGDTTEVVLTDPNQNVTVDIASGTVDPTIDVSAFITAGTGILPQITIESDDADVAIPGNTTVTGPVGWDGIIAAPTVTTVDLPAISGETSTLGTAIEIGFATDKLSFDNAVRILLPGQAGKKVGYVRQGIAFTEITNTCFADSQAAGDSLGFDGDCKINVSSDLVIWTKHFTKFASYTQTTNSLSSSVGTTTAGAPVCNDTKPGSAPVLLSAVAGVNSVTLTWNKASDPVSYYLVTYGTFSGNQAYGNPNVGGSSTTSYTITNLSSGVRYYFKVRAGNGCAPGDYSNEASAAPSGGFVEGVAPGFEAGVLGETTEQNPESTLSPSPEPTPTPEVKGTKTSFNKNLIWLVVVLGAFMGIIYLRKRSKKS